MGPVFGVANVDEATARLTAHGCTKIKDEPDSPRRYLREPYGLIYNPAENSDEWLVASEG